MSDIKMIDNVNLYLIRGKGMDRVEFSRMLKCLGMEYLRTSKRTCVVDEGIVTGVPEFDSEQSDSVFIETDARGKCILKAVGPDVYPTVVRLTSNCSERE